MRVLLFILLFPLFGLSQDYSVDTLWYSEYNCHGSCFDECDSVNVSVLLYQDGGIGVGIDLDLDTIDFSNIRHLDVCRIYRYKDSKNIKVFPYKNKWKVKWIYFSEEGVVIKHRHKGNIFGRCMLVYH